MLKQILLRVMMGAAVLWLAQLASCGGGSGTSPPPNDATLKDVPTNTRPGVLAISSSARLDPYPTTPEQVAQLANEAFSLAFNAGARGQMITYRWSALEPDQHGYAQNKLNDLDADMHGGQLFGMVQYLGIQIINTSKREMPSDIANLDFDNPTVMARFHALLDKVITPYRGRIKYLSIGNEVDAYLRVNPAQWARYQRFYEDAARYAKTLDPGLLIGVTATASGAVIESPDKLKALNAVSDVVILTYYPLDFNGGRKVTVKDPSVVAADFASMLTVAGAKALLLQEVGYPASPVNESSEDKQAAFVSQVFAAWQNAGGRIPFLNYFLLHDVTPAMCTEFESYYGAIGLSGFKEFLCTLGLRQANGTERQAWPTLIYEAKLAHLP